MISADYIDQKNNALKNVYKQYVSQLIQLEKKYKNKEGQGLSAPFLINFSQECFNQKFKVLIVGQESYNYWYRTQTPIEDANFIQDQMNEYAKFVSNKSTQPQSAFWRAIRRFKEEILNSNNSHNLDFMWTNLCKYDYYGKKPPLNIQKEIYQAFTTKNHILLDEINIYEPDIVIFMTGPSYDWYLQSIFDDIKFDAINEQKTRSFAHLSSVSLPKHAYRIYHPNYLSRMKILETTIRDIASQIQK